VQGRGYQGQGLGIGPPITPPVIKGLLIANGVVYLAQMMFQSNVVQVGGLRIPVLDAYGAVWPALVWQGGYLWQPFTYMWMHASLGHIAMNMFMLWMFGSQLALAWGRQRFLRYYLICGFGAGIIIATAPYLTVALGITQGLMFPTLGASGAIYGIVLAYSVTWPERTIMLIFPPVAFRAIWLIPIMFFMTYLFAGSNISHAGHLGGVVVGWLYLRRKGHGGTRVLTVGQLKSRWHRYRMRQKLRAVRFDERRRNDDDERRLH
jgi:membrane associated rhomboid family serine protease